MQKILSFLAAMLFCCCSADNEVKAEVPTNTGKTLVVYCLWYITATPATAAR